MESELFGYRAGAHSTARGDKPGLIERAAGGTLFLDEIGELPQEGQAKLLRFLQDRELTPLGGRQPRRIDVSIVAATNQPVEVLRADLVGRLGAAPVLLPPLRDRREDLGRAGPALPARLAARPGSIRRASRGRPFARFCLHAYPLNVRELQKVLGAAVALTQGQRAIALGDLPPAFARAGEGQVGRSLPDSAPGPAATGFAAEPPPPQAQSRRPPSPGPSAAELEALLARHGGNVAEVSRSLGRQRAAVWRWIKRFGLAVQQHRAGADDEGDEASDVASDVASDPAPPPAADDRDQGSSGNRATGAAGGAGGDRDDESSK